MIDISINYFTVFGAAVVTMVVGFIWYGPLFGKAWSRLMGKGDMTPEMQKEMQKKAMPGYVVSFIGSLVMAYVLTHLFVFATAYMKTDGWTAGLSTAFWAWLGFVVPVTLGSILWEGKSILLWKINAGYYLVTMLAMGAIIGYFA